MSRKTMLVLCWVGLALGTFALMLVPVITFAQDATTTVVVASPPWWVTLLEIALSILAPVLAALLGVAIRWLAGHLKAKATQTQLAMLQQVSDLAVGYAEEYARKKLREAGAKASSNEKLNIAVDYAAKLVREWKLPQQGAGALIKLIESSLGQGREQPRITEHS